MPRRNAADGEFSCPARSFVLRKFLMTRLAASSKFRNLSACLALLQCIAARAQIPAELSGFDVARQQSRRLVFSAAKEATVVLFLSAKCPCSIAHEPAIRALQSEFEPRGVGFIAIHSNSDEDFAMTRAHFEAAQLPMPVLQDGDSKWAQAFGALKTPHAFIVGREGKILYQGGVDDSADPGRAKIPYLKNALTSVLAHQPPEPAQTRALGCMIRRP